MTWSWRQLPTRMAHVCYEILFYLGKTVLPVGIAAFYEAPVQMESWWRICKWAGSMEFSMAWNQLQSSLG